jgi:hypothetical protein
MHRGSAAYPPRLRRHGSLEEHLGRLSFSEQRRPVLDGSRPAQGTYRSNYTGRASGLRDGQHPPQEGSRMMGGRGDQQGHPLGNGHGWSYEYGGYSDL